MKQQSCQFPFHLIDLIWPNSFHHVHSQSLYTPFGQLFPTVKFAVIKKIACDGIWLKSITSNSSTQFMQKCEIILWITFSMIYDTFRWQSFSHMRHDSMKKGRKKIVPWLCHASCTSFPISNCNWILNQFVTHHFNHIPAPHFRFDWEKNLYYILGTIILYMKMWMESRNKLIAIWWMESFRRLEKYGNILSNKHE